MPHRANLLLAVALLALVVRLVYLWQIAHAPFFDLRIGDAKAYHEWALRIAGGDWIGDGVFYQAPLYPYFLAVVYRIVGDGAGMIRFVQAAIGAASCTFVAAAGMALVGEWGALAGVMLALYPPAIFFDGLLEKSVLVGVLMAALLYLLSARERPGLTFLTGIVLGLLTLARENALLLALPIVAWLFVSERETDAATAPRARAPAWRAAAAFAGGCALVLLPVGARNYAVGGQFILTTSQFGPNFYIGNHHGARGLYVALVPGHGEAGDERDDAVRLAEEAAGRPLTAAEVSSFWTARALTFIRAQPGEWIGQLARKLALTFNASEIADTESQDVYAEWSPLLRVLAPFGFGVIFCLAAAGACLTAAAWRRLWFLYAIAATYTLSVVVFYVFGRYRYPLVLVLMLLAAGGIAAWRESPAPQARRRAAAAGVVAAIVAYLPLVDTRIDRLAHYVNIANLFLGDATKWDQSAAFYDKALRESPKSAAAHFGMGTLLAQRHRTSEAIAHYRAAVEGWPDNAELRLNFATALVEADETAHALDQLNALATLRPRDPTPHVLAGTLLMNESRTEDARKAFDRALALDPNNRDATEGLARLKN